MHQRLQLLLKNSRQTKRLMDLEDKDKVKDEVEEEAEAEVDL